MGGGATARVTIEVFGADAPNFASTTAQTLKSALVEDLSSILGVADASIQDLFGRDGQVTLAETDLFGRRGSKISAFITVPAGASTSEMADSLYSDTFRNTVVNHILAALDQDNVRQSGFGSVSVGAVAIHPEPFSPLTLTNTATTSTATSSTGTNTRSTLTTTRALDMSTLPSSSSSNLRTSTVVKSKSARCSFSAAVTLVSAAMMLVWRF